MVFICILQGHYENGICLCQSVVQSMWQRDRPMKDIALRELVSFAKKACSSSAPLGQRSQLRNPERGYLIT